jgi:alanyl-tRNA synthetase
MTTDDLIRTFLEFFSERGHRRWPGSSLVPPPGDPVLYTTSGMHPLTPYLEGRPHPLGRRLVGVQRCLRTTDLDEVGDRTHLTVFEMLGTWSLGDYGGEQSLRWGFELLRDGFGVEPGRVHVTVFGGDDQVPVDEDSLQTWHQLGVRVELTRDDNWWSNGPTGPCGPDSEMFVWTGPTPPEGTPTTDDRWVEVWNHVMMRYRRLDDGSLQPLVQPNVDTGLGLERLLMVVQGRSSVYETDLFEPWMRTLPELWRPDERSLRLLSRPPEVRHRDHRRRRTPSNTGRGYVLRRLLRRVLTGLWRDDPSRTLSDLPLELIEHTLGHFSRHDSRNEGTNDLEHRDDAGAARPAGAARRGAPVPGPARARAEGLSHERFQRELTPADFDYLHDTHGLPRDLVVGLHGRNGS